MTVAALWRRTCHFATLGKNAAFRGGSTFRVIKMSAAAFLSYMVARAGAFGIHDRTAVLLACHGYTALAYDWCGSHERPVDGLPSKVVDIPIEGPVKALRWLQRHESVRNKPVAIYGISRGAELAMIIATLPRDPKASACRGVSVSGVTKMTQNPIQCRAHGARRRRSAHQSWSPASTIPNFSSPLSCSLSRGGAQFFTPPPRTAPIVGAHSRRQDPKTPVEQALMRGLGTA